MTVGELWKRGQEGWPRRFPLAQLPNPPLIAALAGIGVASRTSGTAHDVARAVSLVGFVVWGLEEALGGANWFRRLVGAGALVWLGVSLAGRR
jgi:hypothetical protein